MLKENAWDAMESAGVLAHDRVFKLENIDPMGVDLAVNEPGEIRIAELAYGVRLDRAERFLSSFQADDVLDRAADPLELLVRFAFMRVIEKH